MMIHRALLALTMMSSIVAAQACARTSSYQARSTPPTAPSASPASVAAAAPAGPPSVQITAPAPGSTVTTSDIPVQVRVQNFQLSPSGMGKSDRAGAGHWHLMLDGMDMSHLIMPVGMDRFSVPGRGVAPGRHTIIAVLAQNEHDPVMIDGKPVASQVTINYQPTQPVAAPAAVPATGEPSVRIIAPANGATVPE